MIAIPRIFGLALFLIALMCVNCVWSRVASADQPTTQPTTHWQQPDAEYWPELFEFRSTCNSYLLKVGSHAMVIDPGDGSLVQHLNEIGVDRVEWILMTDHHREGCQGLGRFAEQKSQLAVPETERRLFESPTMFRKWYPNLGDEFSVYGASYVRPLSTAVKVDRGLLAGEVFEWQGLTIQCLSTAGHSPGGMTYLLQRDDQKLAFCGGVIHDGAKMSTWFDTEWDYGFAKGLDILIESVGKLAEQRPTLLLPGLGPAIRNPSEQLASYQTKLTEFRRSYVRGYPVFDATEEQRDPISKPTAVPLISQVSPHLYKLREASKGRNFAIIVSDAGRGLILDCGLFPEAELDEIILGMRQHCGLKEIDAFWISHMHGDHFLLGPALKQKYGAEAWTLDKVVDRCENPRAYDYAALVSAYSDGFDGMKIDRAFADGETIEWEGYTIQVDWMPGQTEFGCCLWLELDGNRIAFTGDNLFGTPSDPSQDGHEAVVARNSAIFEEGYTYAAKYLKNLEPDIVMGSHSFVMPEPDAFLDRYLAWSEKIIDLYRELMPDNDYEYRFDPYWVSAYPYRVDLSEAEVQTVQVTIRNFRDTTQTHRIELKLPSGISAEPSVLSGSIDANSRQTYEVELRVDRKVAADGLQIVPFDITLDDQHYGEWFDFILRTTDDSTVEK